MLFQAQIKIFIKSILWISLTMTASNAFTQDASGLNFLTVDQGQVINASSDIYQEITNEFGREYDNIGKREADRILSNNRLSVTGGLNSIGLTYKRPFVNFTVALDRNLAPDINDEKRWIVTDSFLLEIDASKLFGDLRNKKIIDMSEKNFGAFAGVVFKRKFTWVHYASSYEEGLTRHFEKLFMPFLGLNLARIAKIGPNEMIFKEDSISVKAGGLVSAPIYPGISGMAGVLAKFERMARVEVVSFPDTKSILISSEKEKVGGIGINLAIQADFMKILRMTLLSYDLNYQLESSYKVYLSLKENELNDMRSDDELTAEIDKVLKNKTGDLKILAPYIVSEEKRVSQKISHKYNFLILGRIKDSKTQQIEIAKDGRVKTIFRHYFEKIKYTEDLVSKLFASIIYALTNTELSSGILASDTKQVAIEYDSDKNLLESKGDLFVGDTKANEQKISLTFSSNFKTNKTKGSLGKKYRDRAQYILEHFSGVDPLVTGLIENEVLKSPYQIEGKYQVAMQGIRFFNSQRVDDIFNHIDKLCDEYPKNKWINFRNLFDGCRRSLEDDYIDYFKDLSHDKISSDEIDICNKEAKKFIFSPGKKRAFIKNCLAEINLLAESEWVNIPLWPLKNLANNIVNKSNTKDDIYNLFGPDNVFFYGSFDAQTVDGYNFTTSFHHGTFKGLGVVDHYMRMENLRSPASVVVD